MQIDPGDLGAERIYRLMTGIVVPRPIAWVTSLSRKGVLNLAPFQPHPQRLLKCVDVAVLNEIELSQATGMTVRASAARRDVIAACQKFQAKGVGIVVATLGARGAAVVSDEGATWVPAFKAKVVDTTGAGDCFVGAFAARLAAGATAVEAARFASAAASCSVERLGAAPSMPTARDVAARLARA